MSAIDVGHDKAQRARLVKTALLLLALSAVLMFVSYVPGVDVRIVIAALIVIEALVAASGVARYREALSRPMALAMVSWAAATVSGSMAVIALQLSKSLEAPDLPWLSLAACDPHKGAVFLLCPLAFAADLVSLPVRVLMYIHYAVQWTLTHVGAPALFCLAIACALIGSAALHRHWASIAER